jgi:hypothetical protein
VIVYLPAFIAGWLFTLTLLIIFHLLWNDAIEEIRYGLGAGAICAGCALAGLIIDNELLTFGPAIITSSGLIIVLIQWLERRADERKAKAQKRGEVIGAAHGLTQEIIDGSGERSHRQN